MIFVIFWKSVYKSFFLHPIKISKIFLFSELSKFTHPNKLVCNDMRLGSLPIIEDILPTSHRLPRESLNMRV